MDLFIFFIIVFITSYAEFCCYYALRSYAVLFLFQRFSPVYREYIPNKKNYPAVKAGLGCGQMTLTFGSLVLRFLIGGSAVAAATFIGRRMGGRIGGIFAAFPAVYGSAMVAAAIGLPQAQAVERTIHLSQGALIGMAVNVGCALAAGYFISRYGWKRGLLFALSGWLVVATVIYMGGAAWGWLK